MFPLGLSTCGGKPMTDALFAAYRDAGISHMELSIPLRECDTFDFQNAAALAQKYGITLWSYHLPFMPFDQIDISSTDETLRTSSIAYLSSLIEKAAAVGIKNYVLHASGEPIAETDRGARMACAKESLRTLADVATRVGGTILVENLPRTCLGRDSSDMLELLSAAPQLRAVFDTNHLLSEDPVQFIHKLGTAIRSTHVSDYDLIDEKHWLPGEGKADFPALIAALQAVGYSGPWLYEIGFAAPKTLSRSRDLTCEDFAQNAQALFTGKQPPRIK
jgi:sugar phosphate isomerase/epimerase